MHDLPHHHRLPIPPAHLPHALALYLCGLGVTELVNRLGWTPVLLAATVTMEALLLLELYATPIAHLEDRV